MSGPALAATVLLLGLSALTPFGRLRPEALLLFVLGALVLEGLARQRSRSPLDVDNAPLVLALGGPGVGAAWCSSLYLLARFLCEMALVGLTPRQAATRLSRQLPLVAAVVASGMVPVAWWPNGMAVGYLTLAVALGFTFRRGCEDLLWLGLLLWAATRGPWPLLLAVVALIGARSQREGTNRELKESFTAQMSVSESRLKETHKRFREDKGRFHDVLTLQRLLDDFQGQALQAVEPVSLARELVATVSRMDLECEAAVCRKSSSLSSGGEELVVVADSAGFSLDDFRPLPRGWSTGRMLRSADEQKCFYALAGDLFFLMKASGPESFERLDAFLEHLLARARLILQILENRHEMAAMLQEKTTALSRLAESQAALLQSEKLAAIGQLAAGVAHELNSPLAAIHLQTQMAHRRLSKNDLDGVRSSLEVCQEASAGAKEIIESLLIYSRISSRDRTSAPLSELVGQVMRRFEADLRESEIAWRLQLADLPPLEVCASEVVQILANIVKNAADALTHREGDRRLMISTAAVEGGQQVVLTNNGPPIPDDVLERIFEPFFTTKEIGSGTGLGLSIAYQLARGHEGDLQAANQDGWVSFRLVLPA